MVLAAIRLYVQIDLDALVPATEWPAARRRGARGAELGDGTGNGACGHRAGSTAAALRFQQHRGRSQPFDLQLATRVGWGALPWGWMAAWVAASRQPARC
jgi:hypothetical protein